MLVFMEGGKPECLEKIPRSKDENQQQTQPTYDTGTGNRTWATLVEGECSHYCAISLPCLSLRFRILMTSQKNQQLLIPLGHGMDDGENSVLMPREETGFVEIP